jgi:rod shape-determining protein MreD
MLFALWQAAPRGFPAIGGGRPLILIPLTTAVAMFTGPVGGGAAGAAAGLLWDINASRLFGFNGLTLMALGIAAGLLVRLLLRNNPLSAGLLAVGATLAQGLFDWLINYLLPGRPGAGLLLVRTLLPNALYTCLLALPVYWLVRWIAKKTHGK